MKQLFKFLLSIQVVVGISVALIGCESNKEIYDAVNRTLKAAGETGMGSFEEYKNPEPVVSKNLVDNFDDPAVKKLIQAVLDARLGDIDGLIIAGANVNAIGRGGITPLYCALKNYESFVRLLHHGADPNLVLTRGDSVVHAAARRKESKFLESALNFGGDPSLQPKKTNMLPLEEAMMAGYTLGMNQDKREEVSENVKLLIAAGADINKQGAILSLTPLQISVLSGQFNTALFFLNGDREPLSSEDLNGLREVLQKAAVSRHYTGEMRDDFERLTQWLDNSQQATR